MKLSDTMITRYEEGNFHIDIVEYANMYEAWLSHKSIGEAQMMFRLKRDALSFVDFVETVEANLSEHINGYKEDYFM